jgi:ribosomal protein S18 acetylase RimI-like enzyme
MQQATIRTLGLEDLTALSELATVTYAAAFGHTFSASDLEIHLNSNLSESCFKRALRDDIILAAEFQGRIIGFVQFGPVRISMEAINPADRELRRLYVLSEFQGRGIGRSLMDAALNHPKLKTAPNIYLDVWEHNAKARKLYRRYGFEEIGENSFAVASGTQTDRDLIMVRRS